MKIIEANPDPYHDFSELAFGDVFKIRGSDKTYMKIDAVISQGYEFNAFCFDDYDLEHFAPRIEVTPYDAELIIDKK